MAHNDLGLTTLVDEAITLLSDTDAEDRGVDQ